MNARVVFLAVAVMASMKIVSTVFSSNNHLRQSTSAWSTDDDSRSGASAHSLANNVLHASQQHGHWVGLSWVPPSPSWRLYDPVEMLHAYSGKSMLFIGDSTSRRLAQTLFSLLEETENGLKSKPATLNRYQQASNVPPVANENQHVSYATLNDKYKLEYNKYKTTEVCPFLEELSVFEHNGTINSLADASIDPATRTDDVGSHFPYWHGFCHRTPTFPNIPTQDNQGNHSYKGLKNHQATSMFVSLAKYCPFQVEHWIRSNVDHEYNPLSRFDVVVIGTGVWAAVRPNDCRNYSNLLYSDDPALANRDHVQIVEETMLTVAEYIETQYARLKRRGGGGSAKYPKIPMIVWRTAGYDQNMNHDLIDSMNLRIIDLYETIVSEKSRRNSSREFHMADYFRLVDWGGAVRPRSFHR
jgi:hypothetical protein